MAVVRPDVHGTAFRRPDAIQVSLELKTQSCWIHIDVRQAI